MTTQHRLSAVHLKVDYFSWQPHPFCNDDYAVNKQVTAHVTIAETLTTTDIREAADQDSELVKIKRELIDGQLLDPTYSVHQAIVIRDMQAYIPAPLCDQVLNE